VVFYREEVRPLILYDLVILVMLPVPRGRNAGAASSPSRRAQKEQRLCKSGRRLRLYCAVQLDRTRATSLD
jgi:hypothetical protein